MNDIDVLTEERDAYAIELKKVINERNLLLEKLDELRNQLTESKKNHVETITINERLQSELRCCEYDNDLL